MDVCHLTTHKGEILAYTIVVQGDCPTSDSRGSGESPPSIYDRPNRGEFEGDAAKFCPCPRVGVLTLGTLLYLRDDARSLPKLLEGAAKLGSESLSIDIIEHAMYAPHPSPAFSTGV